MDEPITESTEMVLDQATNYWALVQPYVLPVVFAILILIVGRIIDHLPGRGEASASRETG